MNARQILLGALCCLIPIVLIGFLAARGISMGWILILLCPLMHLFMMKGMHDHGHGSSDDARKPEEAPKSQG